VNSVLNRILEAKREEVAEAKAERPSFAGELVPSDRDFRAALAAPGRRFILEVKKASPSRGPIRPDLRLAELLPIYDRHADAVSVLTDSKFFGGSGEDLRRARRITSRPLLRKDFIVDAWQIDEARHLGADAVLLIAAALGSEELREFREQAERLSMDALVEVHDEDELARALAVGAKIIGINNRNLKDLSTDLGVTERLAPLIPEGIVSVTESGVESRGDVLRLSGRTNAYLIGSSILAAENMAAKVKELVYGPVKICGITRRSDALMALDAGATWLGFIFHPSSPRAVTVEQCLEITRGLPGLKVGVFVDQPAEEIAAVARRCALHGVQVHGASRGETIRYLKSHLDGVFVTWALPVGDAPPKIPEAPVDYFLLDTATPTHGGSGRSFEWNLLAGLDRAFLATRVILAGGLGPENAALAARVGAYALDLASGVESEPGLKDGGKLAALFAALRH